ncbi:hypothetical protein AB833_10225 [Chromatiales bacterium (ex Bugula neritina AB1)]|nr:hypothetical protein AB833_10225 [Chromatiales bacterium (ex Bugula neritina AB1)]
MLAGCDSLVDCLDGDGPIFNKGTLNEGVLNEVYSDTVIASVDNEPRDDRFAYRFTLTGALPAGIQVRQTGRRLLFTGTATDSGDFPLTLFVTVDDGLSAFDSGLCYRSRTEDFVLRIREI